MATISARLQQEYQNEMDLIIKAKKDNVLKRQKANTGLPNNTVGITSGMVNKTKTNNNTTKTNNNTTKTTTKTSGSSSSAYDRNWQQNQAQFGLQNSQLDQSYQLALSQLNEQEKEEVDQTKRLAQQSYIAKRQAEKVLPNQLSAMGLSQSGYESTARQDINQQHMNQYEQYMYNLGLAKAAIKRARESQTMNYNQNKASMDLNRQQAYNDYAYSKQQAIAKSKTKVSIDDVIKNALNYGSAERAAPYLQGLVDQKLITREEARRIYNEYGQYWSYYRE